MNNQRCKNQSNSNKVRYMGCQMEEQISGIKWREENRDLVKCVKNTNEKRFNLKSYKRIWNSFQMKYMRLC